MWVPESIPERLLELERVIVPSREDRGSHRIARHGGSPLIFSAPHAVEHLRDGRPKAADFLTGSLALVLAERLRGTAIVSTGAAGDPNWDAESPYRLALGRLVEEQPGAIVLDLHGADDRHGFGVALGSAGWARRWPVDTLERVRRGMEGHLGEPVWLDGPLFQAGDRTLTAHVIGVLGRPAIQVEIARRFRRPRRRPQSVLKLVAAVDVLCEELIEIAVATGQRSGP